MSSTTATAGEGTVPSFARAVELHRAGRLAEAEELYRALASSDGPFAADARINLGAILDESGRHDEALLHYLEVLPVKGEDPVTLNNMGNSLLKLGRFPEAAEAFRRALRQAPECREARLGLGAALLRDGDAPGAVAVFREALREDPSSAEAHWNLSLALLMCGAFREGWREYQWRWRRESFTSPRRAFKEPLWDGSPLDGRRILIHAEQGLGDTIQFMRYLPLVAAAGGVVLAECQSPSLRPLLERMEGVSALYVMGEELPEFDLQAPLLSLPHLFGTTVETIPCPVPYVTPDPQRVRLWEERLPAVPAFRVGIVWAGKAVPDPLRSCPLQAFTPLGEVPGVALYSLQLDQGALAGSAGSPEFVDLTPVVADFGDTAALISLLDLVIAVDTSVAHLAGAMGKAVWLLLPRAGDYRWMLKREDSPWYPTMRIFRQERQGEWGAVLDRVTAELKGAAWRFLQQASAREPLNGWWFYHCGAFLAAEARHREATVRFTKAVELLPREWEPLYELSASLQHMGLLREAEASLQQALEIDGERARLHEALGIVRQMRGDLHGAVTSYQEAVQLDPSLTKARFNLATACRDLGRFEEALAGFAEVVRLAPGHEDAHWNLAVLLLMHGDFAGGWREFAWRFKKSDYPPLRRWQEHPQWDGSPLEGRTILLYAEQGLGDTLHFIRYAPMVSARGGRVLVEVQCHSLVPLLSHLAGVSAVFAAGEEPPPFDLQASLLDLPQIFATDIGTVPAAVPYLHAPTVKIDPARLVPRDGSFRVGIVWRGNPRHINDANRSTSLESFAPLAGIEGVSWYALQLREGDEELDSPLALKDLSPVMESFAETAALVTELDLVVTVDTSVAHLCGALGLPVWVLIPFVPDWRWLLGRDDSPWYPTMRLFRQESPGDWAGVIMKVLEALRTSSRLGRRSPAQHKKLALSLTEEGRYDEAVREFEKGVAADPNDLELLNNLGCALDGAGRHVEAMHWYQRAISLRGDLAAPHYNMGNSLRALGFPSEAAESYRRALSLDPSLPQGWHNLALSLQDLGRLDEAQQALERAVTLRPDYPDALQNLGALHHLRGDAAMAMECFREALAIDPGYLPSWNALGIALQERGRAEEAAGCYQKALSLDPEYLHALNNLGAVSKELGMLDRAIACYRRVIGIDPGYADAHWNLALVQLLLGEYREGWQGYEWRFRKADPVPRREFPQPLWDGTPLDGRVILLHSEQGFGDTIQFVRYASVLARLGGTVLVECQHATIAPVVATVPGVAGVLVRGDELPPFDVHAPLMSLPLLCRTTLTTIPVEIPYVSADPSLVQLWRSRLAGDNFKVGIVWAGRKSYRDDRKRSPGLGAFASLGEVAGVRLYSLQVGEGAEQAESPPPGMELVNLAPAIKTFADTAAIIENLDLVISADTAVAHLAGALGKRVWVLLPAACDWRWLLDRDDSPWYPTARLFRQQESGDWEEVLERVARGLAEVAGNSDQEEGAQRELEELSVAVALHPQVPELRNNLGVMLERLGRNEEAAGQYREALALRPCYCEARCHLGNALGSLGREDEAVSCYRAALAIDPSYRDAHYNLGNALRRQGKRREAAQSYRALLALAPRHLSGWINLAGTLLSLNLLEEAIEAGRRAVDIEPQSADGHWNLALALLAAGNCHEGWREYEWRLRDAAAYSATFAGRPMWDGSPLRGRTLLLRSEQGFGDALHFFRFVPLLAGLGASVVVECRRELFPLFVFQLPEVAFFASGEEPPPFDTFAYLMSLPFLLKSTLANLPAEVPYLKAEPGLVASWRARMQGGEEIKVGLAWAGSSGYRNDRQRSMPLRFLEPLATVPGLELYSLQLGAAGDLAKEPWGAVVHDLATEVRDFADTAAIVANLDLVVSVDTAVAHLAGAMGKPVFLMLPESGDWRWLTGRSDSPWYPTMRLFRQPSAGDWESVVAAVVKEVAAGGTEVDEGFRRANALRVEGRAEEAIAAYRRLLVVQPEAAAIHNNLGLALQDLGRLEEAAASYRRALSLDPRLPDAHNNLGTLLVAGDQREAAVDSFSTALRLRNGYLPAMINLGAALQHLERPGEAVPLYRRAIELHPDAVEPRVNLGTAYQEMMQPGEAVKVYQEALRLHPSHREIHWNLALSLLSLGDFEGGWPEYEWRSERSQRWDGSAGGSILLECEQGLGDTLQFVRYAPMVAARGVRVVLQCQHQSLKPLLARVPGVAAAFARGEGLPRVEHHALLLSLPHLFGTTLDTIPAAPYLFPDPERVAHWRARLPEEGKLKAGLVWQGGALPKNRACPYRELAPLSTLAGVSFYALQLGEAPDPRVLPARDLADAMSDFGETAAIIANLDLIITVDTAAAHLAGGMGRPVWLMLPFACDWRWMTGRSDSPWYPTMRIFRQESPGEWKGVVGAIKNRLEAGLTLP